MNHNNNCKVSCDCTVYILKILLVGALILMNIFLCVFLCINKNEDSNGAIIPFASTSSTGISLTTDVDGTPMNMALLSFGYGQNISAVGISSSNMNTLNFNLQYVPWETSFVMPRDGEITSISFSYTNAEDAECYDFNTRMIVKLYAAPSDSQVFNAIPEATFELDRVLNGMLLQNEIITGNNKDLAIPITQDTKLLLAIYLESDNPDNVNKINLIGGVHAGINIK